jgi:hypothetical protein
MRERARTDLCGGRSVMIVPTATTGFEAELIAAVDPTAAPAPARRMSFRPATSLTRLRADEVQRIAFSLNKTRGDLTGNSNELETAGEINPPAAQLYPRWSCLPRSRFSFASRPRETLTHNRAQFSESLRDGFLQPVWRSPGAPAAFRQSF